MTIDKARVIRGARRANYDRAAIHRILDDNLVCHVGFIADGEACVIPTAYLRAGDAIYLHGNRRNRMINALLDGQTACLSVVQLDGLVLARSGMHSSVNYRSVVVYGRAEPVADKVPWLNAFVDRLAPGRSTEIRPPTRQELDATIVVRLPIDAASAKIRTGEPTDDEADYAMAIWAGVVPLYTTAAEPVPCPRLPPHTPLPACLVGDGQLPGRH